nr:histone deacetylase 6-like [Tanacetum cinerariifolium]
MPSSPRIGSWPSPSHKYVVGFFPQIGHFEDIGHGDGTGYSLNVPLDDGLDDDSFVALFKLVIQKVMDVYQRHPNAVVLECCADSLFGDLLGTFNLSIKEERPRKTSTWRHFPPNIHHRQEPSWED